jgi:ATP-dependent Clp protease ATP-binding subunit ClpB
MEARVTEALRSTFKPEFLNRIDEIIIFHGLGPEQIDVIVDIQLERLRRRLAERRIELDLDAGARRLLARRGYDPVYGARPLKRAIQQLVENPLALDLLKGRFPEGARVRAKADGDRIVFGSV